jgi:hypothetical protein
MDTRMRSPTDPSQRDQPGKPGRKATPDTKPARKPADLREDRLKMALKANMARRKAQAQARGAGTTAAGDLGPGETDKDGQG